MIDIHDTADLVSKALRRAWQLGQTYWQQADSEFQSHWKKADATQATFDQLVEDTRAAILTSNSGTQPAPSAPSEEAAAEMGANGGHVVEAERLAFEAWMRGHCWKLGAKWTGTEYRSAFEKGGMVDMYAMRTRELWAAWRDRAALAAAPEAKP